MFSITWTLPIITINHLLLGYMEKYEFFHWLEKICVLKKIIEPRSKSTNDVSFCRPCPAILSTRSYDWFGSLLANLLNCDFPRRSSFLSGNVFVVYYDYKAIKTMQVKRTIERERERESGFTAWVACMAVITFYSLVKNFLFGISALLFCSRTQHACKKQYDSNAVTKKRSIPWKTNKDGI